jgi:hypothetical protein
LTARRLGDRIAQRADDFTGIARGLGTAILGLRQGAARPIGDIRNFFLNLFRQRSDLARDRAARVLPLANSLRILGTHDSFRRVFVPPVLSP